jgi:hypothetical protein
MMPNYGPASPIAASRQYVVVTPSDSVNFTQGTTRWLYVGGTGNITAVMEDETTCLFSTIPAGALLPISCKRINSTATTATTIVALF